MGNVVVHEVPADEDDDATTARQASEVAAIERSGQLTRYFIMNEESEVAANERNGH